MNHGSRWRARLGIPILLLAALGLSLIGSSGIPKTAEAANQNKDARKRFEGTNLKFNVPEDWPIEERGGTVGPVPIEEYLGLKFNKAEERLKGMEAKLAEKDAQLADLSSRLKVIEDWVPDIEQRLNDLEDWLKRGQARRLN